MKNINHLVLKWQWLYFGMKFCRFAIFDEEVFRSFKREER